MNKYQAAWKALKQYFLDKKDMENFAHMSFLEIDFEIENFEKMMKICKGVNDEQ